MASTFAYVSMACVLVACLLIFAALLVRTNVFRRPLVRGSGAFPCTVRVLGGTAPRLPDDIRGCACRAMWAHDVLLLHRRFLLPWSQPLAARVAESLIEPAGSAEEDRLGIGAIQLRLRLDDDSLVAVAAPEWARERLAGPFVAIAVQGLPPDISRRPTT
jgi:hypothetical protein